MDLDKVQVILDWPRLKSLTEIRGFLGLISYYRRFVQGYGQMARPLTKQLKKECNRWEELAEKAFQLSKEAMTQAPVLAMPNFSKPFFIEIDASGFAIGVVLMQEEHHVAFHSQV